MRWAWWRILKCRAREFKMTGAQTRARAQRAGCRRTCAWCRRARAPADFHARFDAAGKQYRYFVWNHTAMNPLLRRQAWQVPRPLDLAAMRAAARLFLGKHDFKSFAATRNYEAESTVRTLTRCDVKRSGPLLTFIIEGDGFLYKMCRGIVGTLVQVGQGKFAAGEIKRILAQQGPARGGHDRAGARAGVVEGVL